MKQKKLGLFYGAYILSMLIIGTNGYPVSKMSLDSGQIVLMRTLIGGLLLTVVVLLMGGFDRKAIRSEWVPLLIGGAALGLNWVALFTAYRMLNVSLATLIYYAGPMIVLLLSPILFKEKLTGSKLIAVAVVAVGLVCISGSIAAGGLSVPGLLWAVLAALLYATLITFNKRIVRTSGLQTAAIELDVAFVVVIIYVLCTTGLPHIQKSDVPYVLWIGAINTGLAYLLYFSGLQKLPGQSVALISYVDPVSALIFSALLLGEKMTAIQLIGAVLIIGGAMLGELLKRNRQEDPASS